MTKNYLFAFMRIHLTVAQLTTIISTNQSKRKVSYELYSPWWHH